MKERKITNQKKRWEGSKRESGKILVGKERWNVPLSLSCHICNLCDKKRIIKVINFKTRLLWIYVSKEESF